MIEEIRRACGITPAPPATAEEDEPDEPAADVRAGTVAAEHLAGDVEFIEAVG